MGSINYLQELAKETKKDISAARKKNVIMDQFFYHDYHGNPVKENDYQDF